ncbi:hypothetical protein AAG570_005402 [Ranatra chinensis]|uniref:2-methoxy-6-polyprenyl-1,4-benzoquinol methylase, mitochondrial n=1 Tax=Ranatra chinensis TaxID=642074 RepID=A0ABD0Y0M7_9HEMI
MARLAAFRPTPRRLLATAQGGKTASSHEEHPDGWDKTADFGFERVTPEEKTSRVYSVFERVAGSYDVMNDAMSLGLHRVWKDVLMERLAPPHGTRLLDVAGGTGDIAYRFLKYLKNLEPPGSEKPSHVTVSDINRAMLDAGRERWSTSHGEWTHPDDTVDWLEANAEQLPVDDESYSAYTIAFGIRNVTDKTKALREAYRVLRPGGRFMCLEFSRVDNRALSWAYDQYSFQVIPALGHVIAGDWHSYRYLVESIRKFPDQETFAGMIRGVGFKGVTYENLTFGVVAIHSGFKV